MITILLFGFLAFAICMFVYYGVMLIGCLVTLAGCFIGIAALTVLYPFAWLLDQWLNARRKENEDGLNIVINIVDDETRIEPLFPNAKGIYKVK